MAEKKNIFEGLTLSDEQLARYRPDPPAAQQQSQRSAGGAQVQGPALQDAGRRLPKQPVQPGTSPMFGLDGPGMGGGSEAPSDGGSGFSDLGWTEVDPKGNPVRTARKRRRPAPVSGKKVTVRDIPAEIIQAAKAEFPSARNQTDSLVAYIVCNCPELADRERLKAMLTEDQYDLVRNHTASMQQALASKMQLSLKHTSDLGKKVDFLTTAIMFMLYSRLGYLNEDVATADGWDDRDLDGVDGGMFSLFFDVMSRDVVRYVQLRTEQDGRPPGM